LKRILVDNNVARSDFHESSIQRVQRLIGIIESFIKACTLRGYIVNELDVQNRMEIYNSTQEEIHFE
jgi:hypothetical protein